MTEQKIRESLFSWRIENFDFLYGCDFNVYIESPVFRVEVLCKNEWVIRLYSKRCVKTNFINIYFQLKRRNQITKSGIQNRAEKINFDFFAYCYLEYKRSECDLKKTPISCQAFPERSNSDSYELIKWNELEMSNESRCTRIVLHCLMTKVSFKVLPNFDEIILMNSQGLTQIKVEPFHTVWRLEFSNFEDWSASKKIDLPSIPLEITFTYFNEQLRIELFSNIEDNASHAVRCWIKLLNVRRSTMIAKEAEYNFSYKRKIWQFPTFISKRDLDAADCFALEEIIIKFGISVQYSSKMLAGRKDLANNKGLTSNASQCKNSPIILKNEQGHDANCLEYLQLDFRHLLLEKKFADVKLRANNMVFLVHKCILAARSPVFCAMFDQDMTESNTGIVEILDVEEKTLKFFLEYIYTGTVNEMDREIALKLLVVADKYQVGPLITKCSTFLESVLSINTACRILLIADMVYNDVLRESVVNFIVNNSTDILSSPEWNKLIKRNVTLATEVLFRISKNFDGKINKMKIDLDLRKKFICQLLTRFSYLEGKLRKNFQSRVKHQT